ncbi:MAG: hypothetical protein JWN15_3908 [Firmicutes bacterium]|nr:hypothetical protein [Bacillota bacterium]
MAIAIVKTDSPDPVMVGSNLTYTLTVTNLGPGAAPNVVVTDLLPASVTLVSAPGCTVAGQTLTCALGTLTPGAVRTQTIVVRPTAPGPIINIASAEGTNTNVALAAQETLVLAVTSLAISKIASANPAFVGGTLTFTIPVTNTGAAPAENVVLTDVLPAGVTFVSANAPCALGPGNVLTCSLGTIPPGATTTVTIQVTPNVAGPITNRATAVAANAAAVTAVTVTQVILAADVAVTKTAAATGEVSVGLTFTTTVTNFGPSTATGVTLVDTLPPNVRFISATPSQGTCALTDGTLTCLLGTLAPGANATVRILVVPTAAGRITNTATVTANEFDPNPANNTASVTVLVNQCCTNIG